MRYYRRLCTYQYFPLELCTYQYFPLEGERRDTYGVLDNFEMLGSNSPPVGKYVVSKILWMGNQICYII